MRERTKKESNVPNLRFKEFVGEWERKKLGEVSEISSGGTPSRTNSSYWNGDIPWVSTTLIDFNFIDDTEEKITEEGLKNSSAKLFPKGSLLIAMYGQGKTRGKVAMLEIEATTNQACAAVMTNSEVIDSLFLFHNLSKRYNEIRDLSNQGGQENLSGTIIKGIEIFFPPLLEQKKIAGFFSLINEKIQTQSKIIEGIKASKTAIAKRIFSRKIRFADFPDEWEVKKLGEVADIKRGASPRPISSPEWFDENSEVGWVRISDVTKSNKYLEKTEQYLSTEGISRSRLVQRDNMIMSICATIGKPIYTKFDVCIHDGFVVFENLKLDKEYLYYYLDFIQYNWYRYGQPGTQVNLNTEIVNNEEIPCPSLPEQKKIATFLSALDQKIEFETRILNLFTKQKHYLLQQMFI
jgi:type I restriction enzyme S subunit